MEFGNSNFLKHFITILNLTLNCEMMIKFVVKFGVRDRLTVSVLLRREQIFKFYPKVRHLCLKSSAPIVPLAMDP